MRDYKRNEHMAKNPKENKDDQIRAFRKAAREAGCEDNEEQFKEALRKIAKAKPAKESRRSK
jgi:hypothetical protein